MEYATPFAPDLTVGNKYEDRIIKLLESLNFKFVRKSNGDDIIERKEFDFIMQHSNRHIESKFEVKTDFKSHTTNNEIFEFKCSGVDSGILATKADFFVTVYATKQTIVFYKTNEIRPILLNYLESTNSTSEVPNFFDNTFQIKPGGDYDNASLILVNFDVMNEFCEKNNIQRKIYYYELNEETEEITFFK